MQSFGLTAPLFKHTIASPLEANRHSNPLTAPPCFTSTVPMAPDCVQEPPVDANPFCFFCASRNCRQLTSCFFFAKTMWEVDNNRKERMGRLLYKSKTTNQTLQMFDIKAKPWKINKYVVFRVDVPADDVAGTMQKMIFKMNAAATMRIECIVCTCKKYTIYNILYKDKSNKKKQKTTKPPNQKVGTCVCIVHLYELHNL